MRLPKRLQGLLKPAARENTEIYSKIKYDRTEGTAEWILKDPTIASWTDRKSDSIAVVTAPAGSGKTFAIAKLVEQLLSRYPQESNNSSRVSVAYYFCKERVQNLSSPAVMLRTIAYQIALNDTVYAKHVMDLAENDDELRNADVAMLWMLLFHRFFQDARGTAYVLVDAIDECEASAVQSLWTAMEQYIVRPSGGDEGKLKLLFVLGSEGAATMSATLGSQIIQVVLDEEKGIADLRIVVRTRATAAFTNRMISPALMEDVQATVVRVANGNYLHASLIMDIVAAMSRESSIHQFIADPPLDLNYAVGHTLKRLTKDLDEDERQDFKVSLTREDNKAHFRLQRCDLGGLHTSFRAAMHDRPKIRWQIWVPSVANGLVGHLVVGDVRTAFLDSRETRCAAHTARVSPSPNRESRILVAARLLLPLYAL
jgi:hypothetical protein